jgi:hypothetical protein
MPEACAPRVRQLEKKEMDSAAARQKVIDHLTTLVADSNEALGASDVWQDYSPRDRAKSLALFQETRDVAGRLLANVQANEPPSRADWRRVMPADAQWSEIYKTVAAAAKNSLDANPPDA